MSALTKALSALDACPERVEFYEKYGTDYAKALRRAPVEDLEWISSHITLPDAVLKKLRFVKFCFMSLAEGKRVSFWRRGNHIGCATNLRTALRAVSARTLLAAMRKAAR